VREGEGVGDRDKSNIMGDNDTHMYTNTHTNTLRPAKSPPSSHLAGFLDSPCSRSDGSDT